MDHKTAFHRCIVTIAILSSATAKEARLCYFISFFKTKACSGSLNTINCEDQMILNIQSVNHTEHNFCKLYSSNCCCPYTRFNTNLTSLVRDRCQDQERCSLEFIRSGTTILQYECTDTGPQSLQITVILSVVSVVVSFFIVSAIIYVIVKRIPCGDMGFCKRPRNICQHEMSQMPGQGTLRATIPTTCTWPQPLSNEQTESREPANSARGSRVVSHAYTNPSVYDYAYASTDVRPSSQFQPSSVEETKASCPQYDDTFSVSEIPAPDTSIEFTIKEIAPELDIHGDVNLSTRYDRASSSRCNTLTSSRTQVIQVHSYDTSTLGRGIRPPVLPENHDDSWSDSYDDED